MKELDGLGQSHLVRTDISNEQSAQGAYINMMSPD